MNHVDKGGHTPIELASSAGSMPMVALLLQHGARVRRDVEFLSVKVRTPPPPPPPPPPPSSAADFARWLPHFAQA